MIRLLLEERPGEVEYRAMDREAELGQITVRVPPPGHTADIVALQGTEDAVCDGLVRAALARCMGQGAKTFTVSPHCGCRAILARLGFEPNRLPREIAEIFGGPCGGEGKSE